MPSLTLLPATLMRTVATILAVGVFKASGLLVLRPACIAVGEPVISALGL